MKTAGMILLAILFAQGASFAGDIASPSEVPDTFWAKFRSAIENHLGRPYAWGASGLKSFDCSGFVWRVMFENGILMKRTTARKLYVSLPGVPKDQRWAFGNIVFFDDLKHCGIIAGPNSFYHAESSIGTNLSKFNPYWRPKICGVRRISKQ